MMGYVSCCINRSGFSRYHLKICTCILTWVLALSRMTDADSLFLPTMLEKLKQGWMGSPESTAV